MPVKREARNQLLIADEDGSELFLSIQDRSIVFHAPRMTVLLEEEDIDQLQHRLLNFTNTGRFDKEG